MRSFPEVVRGGWYWNILRGRVISGILFIVICLCFVAHESHCFQGICVNPQACVYLEKLIPLLLLLQISVGHMSFAAAIQLYFY